MHTGRRTGRHLSDRFAELVPLYREATANCYYLPDGTDWDALNECLVERPALNVHVTEADDESGQDLAASLSYISLTERDSAEVLYEMDSRETPGGMSGYPAVQAPFSLISR